MEQYSKPEPILNFGSYSDHKYLAWKITLCRAVIQSFHNSTSNSNISINTTSINSIGTVAPGY